jgi:hypothetical protein
MACRRSTDRVVEDIESRNRLGWPSVGPVTFPMVAIGCVYQHLPTNELEAEQRDLAALWLCGAGLIATFLTGYVGYIVINDTTGTLDPV